MAGLLLVAAAAGCTEHNPNYCDNSTPCSGGRACNLAASECEAVDSGGSQTGGTGGGGVVDVPYGFEVGGAETDGMPIVDAQAVDGASIDANAADAHACTSAGECADPAKSFCMNGSCVGCSTDQQCQAKDLAAGACRADGRCVQCTAGASCSGATPACDLKTNLCVQCTSAANCSGATPICALTEKCQACASDTECAGLGDPARVACAMSGACVQCTATNATKCTGGTPVCDAKVNACVQCTTAANCAGATPICGTNDKCQACAADTDCAGLADAARGACAPGGACVLCTATNGTACTGATPVCDAKLNLCVQCTSAANCSGATPICGTNDKCQACGSESECVDLKDPLRFACASSGACVQCTLANSAKCTGSTPACEPKTNSCVQCTSAANCANPTPLCGSDDKCKGCAGDSECGTLNDAARGACASGACVQCTDTNASACTGSTSVCKTTTNKCVQCTDNSTCSGNTPICNTNTNTCRKCSGASDCSSFAGQTTCAPSGACVQCTDNSTCSGSTPICNTSTNTCRPCTADSECAGIGPGVCMNHQDGRCASTAETVVVTAGGGTFPSSVPAGKRLLVVRGSVTGTLAWTLTGLPQMTIVGQSNATITGNGTTATVHITGGDIYIRDLSITGGSPGLLIDGGGVAHLVYVDVSNNTAGGIAFDSASFDVRNTTVNSNGSGTLGAITWGGILSNTPPVGGSKALTNVTIQSNEQVGLVCSGPIAGTTSVLSTGNNRGSPNPKDQVSTTCNITPCSTASATCGAQPSPN